jgi:hypothetical protein
LIMRGIRNHAGLLAALLLTFQVGAIAAASVVISCDQGPALEHHGMSGHEGMADCPMLKKEPACPLHAKKHGTHDCDCPTLGCSQTDTGFMALFGAVGILSVDASFNVPLVASNAAPVMSAAPNHLSAVPLAPPPRT